MQAEPQQQHKWLEKLLGNWEFESDCGSPDKPDAKMKGTETFRTLNGLWYIGEGRMEMPGGAPGTSIITLGYDPMKQRYVGTWIGSMMSNLWVYDGRLDETGNVLTLSAEGPHFGEEGKLAQYRDVIEFKSNDHRILSSHMLGEDGQWSKFMTAHYKRVK